MVAPASPVLIEVDGQEQLVVFARKQVAGLDPGESLEPGVATEDLGSGGIGTAVPTKYRQMTAEYFERLAEESRE